VRISFNDPVSIAACRRSRLLDSRAETDTENERQGELDSETHQREKTVFGNFMSAFPRLFLQACDQGFEQMVLVFEGLDEPFTKTLILLPFLSPAMNELLYIFQCLRAIFIDLWFKVTPLLGNAAQESG